jgi:hypothetical protein
VLSEGGGFDAGSGFAVLSISRRILSNIANADSPPVSMTPSGLGLRLLLKDGKLWNLSFLGLVSTFVVEGRSSTGETTAN